MKILHLKLCDNFAMLVTISFQELTFSKFAHFIFASQNSALVSYSFLNQLGTLALRSLSLGDRNSLRKTASLFVRSYLPLRALRTGPHRGLACIVYCNARSFTPSITLQLRGMALNHILFS